MPPERSSTVFVTGSTGLIGARVCHALKAAGHRVVGIDRDPPAGTDDEAPHEWVECDLTDDRSVEDAVERAVEHAGGPVASVVHLAAYYDFSGEPSPLYRELTVEGTRRLLRALRAHDVEQIVFASSLLVMKPVEEGGVVDESSPVEAEWAYPRSKLDAEEVLREERGDLSAVSLRIAGAYDEDCRSIPIAQQMRRIFEKQLESYFFPGDPTHGQPFVHLDDAVASILAAIEKRGELEPYEIFLIGEPDVVSYGELQDVLGEAIHGKAWPTIRIPAPVAKAGAWVQDKAPGTDPFIKPWMVDLADAHMPISIERARERLGWSPERRLRAALPGMAERLLADPRGWYEKNGLAPPDDLEGRAREAEPAAASRRDG